MSWLQSIIRNMDYLRGRFETFEVTTDAERADCLRVLEQVRVDELNRVHGSSALETAAFADHEVHDRLFGARDSQTGDVIACVRSTPAAELATVASSRAEYGLDLVPDELLARSVVITRLAVLPAYRKSAASLSLMVGLYEHMLEAGMLLAFQCSEPGLFPGYLRLGFRPLGSAHAGASGGFRIPLVFVMHDLAHLTHCRSPLLRRLRTKSKPYPEQAMRWFRAFELERGVIDCGVAFHTAEADDPLHAQLTRGLSEAGQRELLTNSMEIECEPGHLVTREGDGGRFMGLVLSGLLSARVGGKTLALLGEGELFGEVSVTLDDNRSADLVAVTEGTRVLTLSRNCLTRLTDPEDRARVWHNIARVLANRLKRSDQ